MRGLIVAAILLAAAAGYLLWSLSGESSATASRSTRTPPAEPPAEPPADDPAPRITSNKPVTPPQPQVAQEIKKEVESPAVERRPNDTKPAIESPSAGSGSGSASPPKVLPLRQERLQEAENALAKNNYKVALEIGEHMMTRYPGMPDGYRVSVVSLCATGELDRAREVFAKLKDDEMRVATVKQCSDLGATLTP